MGGSGWGSGGLWVWGGLSWSDSITPLAQRTGSYKTPYVTPCIITPHITPYVTPYITPYVTPYVDRLSSRIHEWFHVSPIYIEYIPLIPKIALRQNHRQTLLSYVAPDVAPMGHTCGTNVAYICGTDMAHMWHRCGTASMWHRCGTDAAPMWHL